MNAQEGLDLLQENLKEELSELLTGRGKDKPLVISSCPIEPYEWTEQMTEDLEEAIKKVKNN